MNLRVMSLLGHYVMILWISRPTQYWI